MALSAVGKRKLWVTPCCCISENANSGLKRPLYATMGRPKYRLGSSASIRPPVQAQSAGDQNTACDDGRTDGSADPTATTSARVGYAAGSNPNQFWLQMKPLRLPIIARWGISAPFGLPVVPLV
ncbi:MAG: hypothetical protein BWX79_03240 [Alphaproteobacteria bacterium ADurb.Bin100]|nr:MAG: hypothetical protein BWX79_03240 [Alphaproteobacteria bacterium ADurb.Bin100]